MTQSCACTLLIVFLTLAGTSNAAAVGKAVREPVALSSRADVNLTLLNNATSIVQSLDFTANCTLSISWYKDLPTNGAGSGDDTINIDFLRSALPTEYQDESNDQISSFYDDMSSGSLSGLGWIGTAKDDIETACITPQLEKQISLSNLNATQNCMVTAKFLSSLGWITGPYIYTANSSNNTLWLEFLSAALPLADQNLTDLELLVYRNYFLASENAANITDFLEVADRACENDICEVQGYTGNPDIAGIGVILSYTVEAALITIYFVAIHFFQGLTLPKRVTNALKKASDELSDGALFFSLSISTAGWVSLASGTSYYEKLVFTSANVLALSALFAFLGMYTREGGEKRGQWIPSFMIFAILVESAIQYIVYLTQSNTKYDDYACLHPKLQADSYNPTVFEALFFVLLGLSVIAAFVGAFWLGFKTTEKAEKVKRRKKVNETVENAIIYTRIFVQIVAITVMWVELVYLWEIRHIMSGIAGATWSEGAWGFGQILALFIWFPPVIDILGNLILPHCILPKEEEKCKCEAPGHTCVCVPNAGQGSEKGKEDGKAEIKASVVPSAKST
ncbi:hypothetical protein BDZ45DRAFT_726957 [Acephala macrosclerotiorum]|nr:hypothetical protein BDZ45DRAFT_726957 [Acephala macrosclerotiorum]